MKHYLIITIVLILLSCRDKQDSRRLNVSGDLIFLDIANQTESKTKLVGCLEDVAYAVLETNENSLIVEPSKAFHVNDRFYIVDSKMSAVKVFDNHGKYLFDIGRIGKGPGEFLNVSDVQLSFDKKSILVFSINYNTPQNLDHRLS